MSDDKRRPTFDHLPPELAKAIAERSKQPASQPKQQNGGGDKKQG